jgi:hypothetical protein
MHSAGKKIGTIKKAFSDVVRSKFGKEDTESLFILYSVIANSINAILNEIKSEMVDNGVS